MLLESICRILRKPTLYFLALGIVILIILFLIMLQGYGKENNTGTTYCKDDQEAYNGLIEDKCTLVKLPDGKLRGRKAISSRNIEFYAFQEIPYAMPPIGKLRFEDPVPPEKWNGILNVTENTKTCFQFINFLHVHDWRESQTEDCLYLNVYTPVCASSGGSLPVMFYIYGSGYISGASDYDLFGPDHLMENGVIVVTFNHRLGPLGFLSTGDKVIPGNYGMKDQVLALKWVNRNIQYFGGDPNSVSIVGHSSGAASVGLHLMSKLSRGLYNSAVCQSGTSLSSWSYQLKYERNAHHLAVLLDSSFNKNASSEELLKFLRTVPAEEINSIVHNFPIVPYLAKTRVGLVTISSEWTFSTSRRAVMSAYKARVGIMFQIIFDHMKKSLLDQMDVQGFAFTPAIEPDHEKAFLTENMYSAIQEGHMDRVPLLIGIVSEEAFTKYDSDTSVLSERVEKWKDAARSLDDNPASMVLDNMNIVDETEKKRIGEAIRNLYPPGPFANDLGKTVKYFSDTTFTRAIIRHAELQSNYSDVYFYRFSYGSPALNGIKPNFEGTYEVGHGDDDVFMWRFTGIDVVEKGSLMDILASDRYRTLITNFVKYLNPTPTKSPLLNDVIWPKVRPDDFKFLDINETITIQNNLRDETYKGWVKIYEEMARKPILTF